MSKSVISEEKNNQIDRGNLNFVKDLKVNEFFLLDSYKVLEKCKRGNFHDSDGIFVQYYNENEKLIIEDIYKIENFINSYEFICIKTENEKPKKTGLLLPKSKLLNQNKINLILNEIKNSKFIREIGLFLNLDLIRYNFDLKETNSGNIFIINIINNNNNIKNNNYINNKEQNLLSEINLLKNELEKYKKENENLKSSLVKLNKILENQKTNQVINTNNQELKILQDENKNLKAEINELKLKIKNDRKEEELVNINDIMVINFISTDSSVHCGIKCLPTYTFAKVEEELYKYYDDLRNYNNEFIVNATKILRFKKIKENNIHDGDIVQLIKIQ